MLNVQALGPFTEGFDCCMTTCRHDFTAVRHRGSKPITGRNFFRIDSIILEITNGGAKSRSAAVFCWWLFRRERRGSFNWKLIRIPSEIVLTKTQKKKTNIIVFCLLKIMDTISKTLSQELNIRFMIL